MGVQDESKFYVSMKLVSPYWQEEQMFYYNADMGSRQAMLDSLVPENITLILKFKMRRSQ